MSIHPSPEVGRSRLLALAFCFVLVGAVLSPIGQNWQKTPQDNFPLSYYPMFSARRDAVETFYYVVGMRADGRRTQLPHTVIGNGGENQVRRGLRKIIEDGRAPDFAQEVAKRVAGKTGRRYRNIVSVAVCRGKYSVDDWFQGKRQPLSEVVTGSAAVERTQTP